MVAAVVLPFEAHPGKELSVMLFKDVTNAKDLRAKLMSGELEPEFSLIQAPLVPDPFILQVAGHKALTSQARNSLVTRTLHTELVYNLSGSKHIGESLKRVGITDDTTHLLVARFGATAGELATMRGLVQGTEVDISTELAPLANTALLQKHFKLNHEEQKVGSLVDSILVHLAARDCI